MVETNKSWPSNCTKRSPNLNCMSGPLEPPRPESVLSLLDPRNCMVSANITVPGSSLPVTPSLTTEQKKEAHGFFQLLAPGLQTSDPVTNLYLKQKLSMSTTGLTGNVPLNAISGGFQKGLVIFDKSGNHPARMVYSSFAPLSQNPAIAKSMRDCKLKEGQRAVNLDQLALMKPILHEESADNDISEESEMHEDTDEIDALLYSDDDEDEDDDEDDGDEVTSTGHSPTLVKRSYEMQEQVEEITEEVDSSAGPNKRQKLLDGGYNKLSVGDTASSVISKGSLKYHNDAESSYGIGQTQREEIGSVANDERSRKDKIRETLVILEGIIPGAKGKGPLLVLDEAIDYLNSLKSKAKTLRVN